MMKEIIIINDEIQKINNNEQYSINTIKNNIDLLNRFKLKDEDLNRLHDILIIIIEKFCVKEHNKILDILNGCISTNFDKEFFIQYFKIRSLNNDVEEYERYLSYLTKSSIKIKFHSNSDKNFFIVILKRLCKTVNDEFITNCVNEYINKL